LEELMMGGDSWRGLVAVAKRIRCRAWPVRDGVEAKAEEGGGNEEEVRGGESASRSEYPAGVEGAASGWATDWEVLPR